MAGCESDVVGMDANLYLRALHMYGNPLDIRAKKRVYAWVRRAVGPVATIMGSAVGSLSVLPRVLDG